MKTIRQKLDQLVALGKADEVKRFALNRAKSVRYVMKDQRSIKSIQVAEKYLNGKATLEELKASAQDATEAAEASWAAALDANSWAAAWAADAAQAATRVSDDAAESAADADAAARAAQADAAWADATKEQHQYLDKLLADAKS